MLKVNKPRVKASAAQLAHVVDESRRIIDAAMLDKRPKAMAFSGGKDSLPLAHLLSEHYGVRNAVCEVSFFFTKQIEAVHNSIKELGLKCDVSHRLDWNFLVANPELVMTKDKRLRSRMFTANHWATIFEYVEEMGAGTIFMGRRTQENNVPSALYEREGVWQCFPLRAWRTEHVWAYIDKHGITVPFIYDTPFNAGQAPWTSCRYDNDIKEGWHIINQIEPPIVAAAAQRGLPGAAEYLKVGYGG